MTLWVDGDACPATIKDLIIRTAQRLRIMAVFVANKYISLPESSFLSTRRIGVNPEAVDMYIVENVKPGDVAITQDIPLASALVSRGVIVISTRGILFTEDNIGERLSIRNFMQDLRQAGALTPGPKEFVQKDGQRFANTLDRVMTRLLKPKAGFEEP